MASTTVKRWLETLSNFYHCFTIKPWSQNITRSLLKEPKIYLWDWSVLKEDGPRSENFIACHLLKAAAILILTVNFKPALVFSVSHQFLR